MFEQLSIRKMSGNATVFTRKCGEVVGLQKLRTSIMILLDLQWQSRNQTALIVQYFIMVIQNDVTRCIMRLDSQSLSNPLPPIHTKWIILTLISPICSPMMKMSSSASAMSSRSPRSHHPLQLPIPWSSTTDRSFQILLVPSTISTNSPPKHVDDQALPNPNELHETNHLPKSPKSGVVLIPPMSPTEPRKIPNPNPRRNPCKLPFVDSKNYRKRNSLRIRNGEGKMRNIIPNSGLIATWSEESMTGERRITDYDLKWVCSRKIMQS